jgi:hypothetical protein
VNISQDEILDNAIRDRNSLGRKAIALMNGILCDNNKGGKNKSTIPSLKV